MFTTAHILKSIFHCRTVGFLFILSIRTAWCLHTNAYSSVHFCSSTCLSLLSVMWTRSRKMFSIHLIQLHTHAHTHTHTHAHKSITITLTLWLREIIKQWKKQLPEPSHFWFYFQQNRCNLKCMLKARIEFLNSCSIVLYYFVCSPQPEDVWCRKMGRSLPGTCRFWSFIQTGVPISLTIPTTLPKF